MEKTTSTVYLRFKNPGKDDEYVSIEEYLQSAPDTYQDGHDTTLYEFVNCSFVPLN